MPYFGLSDAYGGEFCGYCLSSLYNETLKPDSLRAIAEQIPAIPPPIIPTFKSAITKPPAILWRQEFF